MDITTSPRATNASGGTLVTTTPGAGARRATPEEWAMRTFPSISIRSGILSRPSDIDFDAFRSPRDAGVKPIHAVFAKGLRFVVKYDRRPFGPLGLVNS